MAMHKVPTLVLGIGGIGCRIAANVNDLLSHDAKKKVAIIGIDTNVNDLTKLSARGLRTIQTSDTRNVAEYLRYHPKYTAWFPLDDFTASKSLLNGAGQIRAVSRLGALAAVERGSFQVLKDELKRIRANRGEEGSGNLTVMVVGSITGGTGAGLFLQLPFYIRQIMNDEAGLDNIIIRGMFVGPDLTVGVQPADINRAAVRVNAYACMKELNAMYKRQLTSSTATNLKVDFYSPRPQNVQDQIQKEIMNQMEDSYSEDEGYAKDSLRKDVPLLARGNPYIPYDYLYLIEGSNSDGSIGDAPISSVEALVGRMVHTLMFTPVKDNALSVEDNMVLQDAQSRGMNRYSSAGMTRLVYPYEQALEYVTLTTVRELVRSEWLLIDEKFRAMVAEARSLQRTDGKVTIPRLKTSFPDLFRKQVDGEGCLGKLFSEAFIVTPENQTITRSGEFLNNVDELVEEIIAGDDVKSLDNQCELICGNMNTLDAAGTEVSRLLTALSDYCNKAKLLVKDKPISISNDIFPPTTMSMRQSMGNSRCIYQLMHNVHPLTARFFCYDIIAQLETKIEELSGSFSGINFEDNLHEDFDSKTPGVQTPHQALNNLQNKRIPVLGALISDTSRLKPLRAKLQTMTESQRSLITQYLREGLTLGVYRILLSRFEALAENYTIFFQNVGSMIEANNNRIEQLESLEMPLGQMGIYCSRDAFRIISAEYQNSVDNDLPEATKAAIFNRLFDILSADFEANTAAMTEYQRADHAARKASSLKATFEEAVVKTLRNTVIEKGGGIVDMNIHRALQRQYELKDCEESIKNPFDVYLKQVISQAMRMASPMVAATNNATIENTATAYLALHPDCAATVMGIPDAGATESLYCVKSDKDTGNVSPTALLDEAFSRYEIICFRARYKFSIEDLTKFSPTSENARCYRKRIASLGQTPTRTGNPDDGLTVINPHLDRSWHEEAYLPALYENEQKQNQRDTYKAFLYGLGLDLFVRMTDENILDENGRGRVFWYYMVNGTFLPVLAVNSRIGNNYNDLFNSLSYNGWIKRNILIRARQFMRSQKGYCVAEELYEKIMQDPFIADLVQPRTTDASSGDENLLDTILRMRDRMPLEQWRQLFTGLQDVLWEYCGFMFDQSERHVNNAVRQILREMTANCSLAGKELTSMTFTERELVSQVENLMKAVYRS